MFTVTSAAILYLWGLGYLFNPFIKKARISELAGDQEGGFLEHAGIVLCIGILVNYTVILLVQQLKPALMVGSVFSVIGWLLCGFNIFIAPHFFLPIRFRSFVPPLIISFFYYVKIFSESIQDWDSRVIWFFHAKMIWVEGSINQLTMWHHPSLQWSHPEYPKLLSSLAAQLGVVQGFWNGVFPKGSLFILLLPPIFLIFSFSQKNLKFVMLVFTAFFTLHIWLWNGYMDGYLALYAMTATLLFARYYERRRLVDAQAGIYALGMVTNLKNEGLLFFLCLVFVAWVVQIIYLRRQTLQVKIFSFKLIKVSALALLPTLIWNVYKNIWRLENDLHIGSASTVRKIWTHLTDGTTPPLIFKSLVYEKSYVGCACVLIFWLVLVLSVLRKKPPLWIFIPSATAVVYFIGLYVVYLTISWDIVEFLGSSADRTMLAVTSCLLATVYFLVPPLGRCPENAKEI